MRRIKAVAYAVNGSGLGHLTRTLAILRWCRRLARVAGYQFDAYVLTTSEGCSLAFEEGFAAFKLPSKTAIRDAGIPKNDYLRLARQWVWHSLGLVDPDLLLVDTFPGGSFGELLHALDGPRARVLVYRTMREAFARDDSVSALLPLYDAILLPVEPGREPNDVDPLLASRTHRVGPILLRSRDELHDRARARRRLGVPDGALALWASAGGGGDPTAAQALARVVEAVVGERDVHLVVGAGPLFRGDPVRGPNVTWLQSYRAVEDFAGLDAAISASGYNAFHELLHAGVPTAFYAQEKIADEQSRRVRSAASAGAALALDVDERGVPTTASIRGALGELRDPARRRALSDAATSLVPANFAREAAALVLSTVLPAAAIDEARETGTAELFLDLERRSVDLDDALRFIKTFERVPDLDGAERGDLLARFFAECGPEAAVATRLFPLVAARVTPPTSADAAEALVDAGARAVARAASFGDERAAASLLRMLPAERAASPDAAAGAICDYLDALGELGDSLWRGMSVLGRHLGAVGSEVGAISALRAATAELRASRAGEERTR